MTPCLTAELKSPSVADAQSHAITPYENACQLVSEQYGESIVRAYRTGLAVVASMSLANRDNCLVLVFEGVAGSGKSTVCRMLSAAAKAAGSVVIRVDDFTPKSFVSHAANRNEKRLKEIDLLPRVQSKVMVTKELSPFFSNDEKTLRQMFGVLTSVLDGNGLETNSGTHGRRGYTGDYIFNWIGATTPVPPRTHELMSQLGNRILFCEVSRMNDSEEELVQYAMDNGTASDIDVYGAETTALIAAHFEKYPVGSFDPGAIEFPRELMLQTVRLARLIAEGRVLIGKDHVSGEPEAGMVEAPQRVIFLLKTLILGHALINDRLTVTPADLEIAKHVALSSIPTPRKHVLRAVLDNGLEITSSELQSRLNVSRPTALKYMKEAGMTSLMDYTEGVESQSEPARLVLNEKWHWLFD